MNSDLHRRAKEIFLAVCGLSGDERDTRLAAECGDNTALAAEVESLLRFHETSESVGGFKPFANLDGAPPDMIGHYRLLRKIGEGGMGEVYEAEQERPVRRRVAIKVIKWGMDTKEVVARFESERQALALMDHPNVAKVFDAGATEHGRPYFAMEFVKGVPITEYCDTHRLATDDRLLLFTTVCEAVQHAHQKGIIHRDIKPSNILVAVHDDRAVPKIIDFGVAKATSQRLTERTIFTELGQWIGTPEYMSPEQAEMSGLDIDTRTDVYSLGIVLYELLVGAQPFDGSTLRQAGFDEMRRRIREQEPPRPSTRVSSFGEGSDVAAKRRRPDTAALARELQGDLDWIVMKAIDKDRTRRYPTPMDLADDVRRHLSNEPVEASPPSAVYRFRKFVRRNRLAVAATAVVFLVMLAGIIGTTTGLVRARREAEAARQVVRFMSGIFWGMNPGAPSQQASSIEGVLDSGADRIDRELGGQPLVAAELKTIIGQVYAGLGHHRKARPLLEEALATRLEELGEEDVDVARSLFLVANNRLNHGDPAAAKPLLQSVLSIDEEQYGPDSGAAGVTLGLLAIADWRMGNYHQALETCDRAIANLERSAGPDSTQYADVLIYKLIILREFGEFDTAEALGRRAQKIYSNALGEDHVAVGMAMFELGIVHQLKGDSKIARELLEQSLAIHEAALGPDHLRVSFPMAELGRVTMIDGDDEAAKTLLERALRIRERAVGPNHPDLQWVLRPYGGLYRRLGDVDRALEIFNRALAITERALGPDHVDVARCLGAIAYTIYRTDPEEARRLYERSLAIRQSTYGENHRETGIDLYALACIAARQGDRQSALRYFRQTLDTGWSWKGVPEDPDLDSLRGDPEFDPMMAEMVERLGNL